MLTCLVLSLFPLALYLFFLAGLNRRDRPALVHGVWEAVGLLFGLSGFLLVAGPTLLNFLYIRDVASISLDEEGDAPFDDAWLRWCLIWAAYYLAVVGFAVWLILSRRQRRGIYNVDLEQFRQALNQSLEELSLAARYEETTLYLYSVSEAGRIESSEAIAATPPGGAIRIGSALAVQSAALPLDGEFAVKGELRLEAFPALCHVTLHWRRGEPAFRKEVEQALMKNLEYGVAGDNPAAGWFLGISSLLFGALFMMVALWVFTLFFPRRGI